MRGTQSLSVTLPFELAEMVEAKVASGEYASESEVIEAALLRPFFPEDTEVDADDPAIETWLQEEVAPAFDDMQAHPDRMLTAGKVDVRLDALAPPWRGKRSRHDLRGRVSPICIARP